MTYAWTLVTEPGEPKRAEVHTAEHGEVVAVFYEGTPDYLRRAEDLTAELNAA